MEANKKTIIPLEPVTRVVCCTPADLEIDSEEVKREVRVLGALADPTRMGIVRMLAGLDEPMCVCDILSGFTLSQPTISHHLKVLRDANLVSAEKHGLWVYYQLNRETLDKTAAYLAEMVPAEKALATAR